MKNRAFSYVLSAVAGLLFGASVSTSALQYEPFVVFNAPPSDRAQIAREDAESWCAVNLYLQQFYDCKVNGLIGYQVETDSSYAEYVFDVYRLDDLGPAHTSLRVLMQNTEPIWP